MGWLEEQRAGQLRQNKMNSVYSNGSKITEVIESGQWKGKRCFIIGGGESLKGFDFSILSGEKVIAVNRAFETWPDSDIWYAMDVGLYNKIRDGFFDKAEKTDVYAKWKAFKGLKVYLCPLNPYKFNDKVYFVRRLNEQEVSSDLSRGIYAGNNSGFGALMLAIALGASPIFLLGFDFKITATTHYHSGYPGQDKEQLRSKLETFRKKFDTFPNWPKNISIVNLNPDSALECFRKDTISNVFREGSYDRNDSSKVVIDANKLNEIVHEYKNLYVNMTIRGRQLMEHLNDMLENMEIKEGGK